MASMLIVARTITAYHVDMARHSVADYLSAATAVIEQRAVSVAIGSRG